MAEPGGPAVGGEAPSFTAPLTRPDDGVEEVCLDALLDDRPVLLVFHAAGFDLESLSDCDPVRGFDWFTLEDRVEVVGVSRAKPHIHRKIIDHLELDYPFYTDRDLSIAADYGMRYRAWGVAPRTRQSCFFLDRDGVVRFRWVVDEPRPSPEESPQLVPLYETVHDVVGEPEYETFGFGSYEF